MARSILIRELLPDEEHQQFLVFAGVDRDHRAHCGTLRFTKEEASDFIAVMQTGVAYLKATNIEFDRETCILCGRFHPKHHVCTSATDKES